MRIFFSICVICNLVLVLSSANAAPFKECPTQAFLGQSKVASLYGVNLATGYYSGISSEMGTTDKINALGFNLHDSYLYGWSYEHGTLAKIGDDYQVEPTSVINITNSNFYVGDVSVEENAYFAYRYGSGLYRISLNPDSSDYNTMTLVPGSESISLSIYDMAFHPNNGLLYAVDRRGDLFTIDVTTSEVKWKSYVGHSGTFGAVYFDVDENLYLSRNSDGIIFKVDTSTIRPEAVEFAAGPASSNNDGARCAIAPIIENVSKIDFGDAPDSYGSRFESNGARHDLTVSTLFLGSAVDSESDSYVHPLSDDEIGLDDDDGVSFVTGMEVGSDALLSIVSSSAGYLNAWIDFNGDGDFDEDEKIVENYFTNDSTSTVLYSIPASASSGATWARFRLSSTAGLGAIGGASDGEVEDYKVEITNAGSTTQYYPGQNDFVTIAYEDNWPFLGDFDMNDLVVFLRTAVVKKDNNIQSIKIAGKVVAVGAAYHSGFAVNIPGLKREEVDEDGIIFTINNKLQSASPLELGREEAIFIVTNDVLTQVAAGEACLFYRTEPGCGSDIQMEFSMTIPFVGLVPDTQIPNSLFDPFMFATPGFYHGSSFTVPPGRSKEIHLKNMAPTSAVNTMFLGFGDDSSNPSVNMYYQSENGMPWAIELGTQWKHPQEYIDVVFAYPLFERFIRSSGEEYPDWFMPKYANKDLIFEK